ncbi:MAG: glycerol kinase, partial [Bacteroidaceae bacterium]|nr:glycerol kinase [Bacteroidaceae bacterium]
MKKIIAIDQSTSATKAMLFNDRCEMLRRVNRDHKQYYPQPGWVEHDAEEIYSNTIDALCELLKDEDFMQHDYCLAITNQRETVVVWDKHSGRPIQNAVVWQ